MIVSLCTRHRSDACQMKMKWCVLNGTNASAGSPEAEPVTAQTTILPWMTGRTKRATACQSSEGLTSEMIKMSAAGARPGDAGGVLWVDTHAASSITSRPAPRASCHSCASDDQKSASATTIAPAKAHPNHASGKHPTATISACQSVNPTTSHQETARVVRTEGRARTKRVSTSWPISTEGTAMKSTQRNAQPPA